MKSTRVVVLIIGYSIIDIHSPCAVDDIDTRVPGYGCSTYSRVLNNRHFFASISNSTFKIPTTFMSSMPCAVWDLFAQFDLKFKFKFDLRIPGVEKRLAAAVATAANLMWNTHQVHIARFGLCRHYLLSWPCDRQVRHCGLKPIVGGTDWSKQSTVHAVSEDKDVVAIAVHCWKLCWKLCWKPHSIWVADKLRSELLTYNNKHSNLSFPSRKHWILKAFFVRGPHITA